MVSRRERGAVTGRRCSNLSPEHGEGRLFRTASTFDYHSEEFDRDYAKKYDGDLNASLILKLRESAFFPYSTLITKFKWCTNGSLLSAICSASEQDPNEHAIDSLFPDANTDSVTWSGPPLEIVTVQSLLYASLATSLFAAFIAMLGKQWVNRYLRNRGGSAADKSRDRQWEPGGSKKQHFHLKASSSRACR